MKFPSVISSTIKKKNLTYPLLFLILIVLGLTIYVHSFPNEMFWDDDDFILKNKFIKDLKYLPRYFSENMIAGSKLVSNYWRPFLLLVFSFEWHLWKDWVVGYHALNTAFHIADSIFLFCILRSLFGDQRLGFLTAVIFLIHPVQTEAVVYVNSLGDSLSVFFVFLGILSYLIFRQSGRTNSQAYRSSLLCYVFGLMTKETAFVLPALLFIIEWLVLDAVLSLNQPCDSSHLQRDSLRVAVRQAHRPERSRGNTERPPFGGLSKYQKLKDIFKSLFWFFLIAAVYVSLRATVLNFRNTFDFYPEENVYSSNFFVRLLTFFRVLTIYLGVLFWPVGLHVERSVPLATSWLSASVIGGSLLFFGLLTLAVSRARKWPVASFGILWFFIGLAPSSNVLIPINAVIYEHWLYVPMVGVFLIVFHILLRSNTFVFELRRIVLRSPNMKIFGRSMDILLKGVDKFRLPKYGWWAFCILVFIFSVLSILRIYQWRSAISLYEHTLNYAPTSYRVINNLGMAYADKGYLNKAEAAYQKAISLEAANPVAHHNLANLYRDKGQLNSAVTYYKRALALNPKFIFTYPHLINVYLRLDDLPNARRTLERYLPLTDRPLQPLILLAQIAIQQKDFKAAETYLRYTQRLSPTDPAIAAALQDVQNQLSALRSAASEP